MRQIGSSLAGVMVVWAIFGATGQLYAQEAPCEPAHVSGYAPVITDCGTQVIRRYPHPPEYQDGRWVIEDQGQQFTLVENIRTHDYLARDEALTFYEETGIPIRFGQPQAFDGSEVQENVLKQYIGIYVASESVGEWMVFGLPLARVNDDLDSDYRCCPRPALLITVVARPGPQAGSGTAIQAVSA